MSPAPKSRYTKSKKRFRRVNRADSLSKDKNKTDRLMGLDLDMGISSNKLNAKRV
jgi:hypothetical protein